MNYLLNRDDNIIKKAQADAEQALQDLYNVYGEQTPPTTVEIIEYLEEIADDSYMKLVYSSTYYNVLRALIGDINEDIENLLKLCHTGK